MTPRKFIVPVHIHPILLIFIFISFLTGTFIELMMILGIVLIHEFGHFTAAKLFGWRIRGIMLWVFGGVMETDENGTRPLHEELLVTIAGPVQHVLIYVLLFFLSQSQAVLPSIVDMAYFYNTVILLFNLLPIWPLDGGKLMFLLFSEIYPFRKAYECAIILSLCINVILIISLLTLGPFILSAFLLFAFLFMENKKTWKQRYYVFIRFLLQRYQGQTHFNRIRPVEVTYNTRLMDVFNSFYRDKFHTIYVIRPGNTRQSLNEVECLHSYFHDRNYRQTIGEIVSHVS